jgi:hypothetical protein
VSLNLKDKRSIFIDVFQSPPEIGDFVDQSTVELVQDVTRFQFDRISQRSASCDAFIPTRAQRNKPVLSRSRHHCCR